MKYFTFKMLLMLNVDSFWWVLTVQDDDGLEIVSITKYVQFFRYRYSDSIALQYQNYLFTSIRD